MSAKLSAALVAAQQEMPAVEKTASANYGTYATIDHLIAKTRGVLNKHGLSITQFPEVLETGQPGLRTTITHESGESVSSVMPLLLTKQDMQNLGSAITYARRYAWSAALGISADSDDDGAHASEGEPQADSSRRERASVSAADESEPPSPSDEPAASFDSLGKLTLLIAELVKLRNETPDQVKAKIPQEYHPLEEISEPKALELLGKLERWKSNLEKEQAA